MMARMHKALVLVAIAGFGCGGDDDGGGTRPTAQISVSGDVSAEGTGNVFLCTPVAADIESVDIAPTDDSEVMGQFAFDVGEGSFVAGESYTLEDFTGTTTSIYVTSGGVEYIARPSDDRTEDETATLSIDEVVASSGDDVCSGWVTGTFHATLVETDGSFPPVIGEGRVEVDIVIE